MAKVYPTQASETNAFYDSLDGGTDQEVGIVAPTRGLKGDASEFQWMQAFDQIRKRLQHSTEGQLVKVTTISVGVYPLEYTFGGVKKTYDGVVAVNVTTADNTYYWYLDATNALVESTSIPTTPHVILAQVVITAGVIASITDLRNQSFVSVLTAGQVEGMLPTIDYVIGAESGNDIQITMQIKDADGNNLSSAFLIELWMSDGASGETGTALDNFVLSTGLLFETITTMKHWRIITDVFGKAIFTCTKTGAKTYFARGVFNGKVITSNSFSFT